MVNQQVSDFGTILLFIIGAIVFATIGLFAASLIRPKRPNKEKLTTYECGEEPISSAWGNINIRFYIIALIFVLFEVELIFLFPWATVFGNKGLIAASPLWGWFSLFEMIVFVGVLFLGLVYAWKKKYLDWVKPNVKQSDYKGVVPTELYDKVNQRK